MRWRHQVNLPEPARAALELAPGERVLAAASAGVLAESRLLHVIATDRALHVPADGGFERIPYESILKLGWDQDQATLTVVRPEPAGRLDLPLAEPGFVPETARERVQNTIVYSQHVPLRGSRGVLVSARRAPGGAETRWTVVFDAGLDRNDAELRERAERALAELRAQTGI